MYTYNYIILYLLLCTDALYSLFKPDYIGSANQNQHQTDHFDSMKLPLSVEVLIRPAPECNAAISAMPRRITTHHC